MICRYCGERHHELDYVKLRYNKPSMCLICAVLQPDTWILKYVVYDEMYRVFNAKSYPSEKDILKESDRIKIGR